MPSTNSCDSVPLAQWTRKSSLPRSQDFSPTTVNVVSFLSLLLQVTTSALQVARSLQWRQDYVGVPSPLNGPLLADFSEVSPGHAVDHGVTIPPLWLLRLVQLPHPSLVVLVSSQHLCVISCAQDEVKHAHYQL